MQYCHIRAEVQIICKGCGQHCFKCYTQDVNEICGKRREDFQAKQHKEGVTVAQSDWVGRPETPGSNLIRRLLCANTFPSFLNICIVRRTCGLSLIYNLKT